MKDHANPQVKRSFLASAWVISKVWRSVTLRLSNREASKRAKKWPKSPSNSLGKSGIWKTTGMGNTCGCLEEIPKRHSQDLQLKVRETGSFSLSFSLSLCCCFVFVPILKYVKETWGQWIRGDMLIFYNYHFIFVENDELTYMLGAECSWQMGVCDNAQQTAEGPFQINITNLQQCLLGFNGQNWLTCAETFQYLPWMAVFWAVTHLVRSTSGISRPHHCQKTISLTVIQGIPRCCGGHIGQWQHENAIVIAIHSPQSIFAVDAHGIHATSLNQQLSTLIDWI